MKLMCLQRSFNITSFDEKIYFVSANPLSNRFKNYLPGIIKLFRRKTKYVFRVRGTLKYKFY